MLKARHLMTRSVVTVRPDSTMGHAMDLMLQAGVSGLVVTDDGSKPLGVITEHGLLLAACDEELLKDPVGSHMTRDLICVQEEDGLERVAELCVTHRVRRLPVVRDGKLIGLISRRDVLRGIRLWSGECRRSRPAPVCGAETCCLPIPDLGGATSSSAEQGATRPVGDHR